MKAPNSSYPEHTARGSVLLGLLCGVVYLVWVCPGIYWRDAGELTASAFGLGVAHPTGFPTWILLAKFASYVPLGSIAFRINVMSSLMAGLCVGLTYSLALRLIGTHSRVDRSAAAVGALLLGLGATFWLHATTAEVYIPNLLAIIGLIHLVLNNTARSYCAAAVLTGLGTGLHVVFVLVAAVVWFWVLSTQLSKFKFPVRRIATWVLLSGTVSLAVQLYLPIRALQDPWRNWGNPSSLSSLMDHLTGARIRGAFGEKMGLGSHLDVDAATAIVQLAEQLSWGGLIALMGLFVVLFKRSRPGFLILLVGFVDYAFTVSLNPMGMVDYQTGLTTTLCAVLFVSVGFARIGQWLERAFSNKGGATLLFIAAMGLVSPAFYEGGTLRNTRTLHHPLELGDFPFDQAPPETLMLVTSDNLASTTTYLHGVENRRPDMPALVKQHVADQKYIERLISHHGDTHFSSGFAGKLEANEHPVSLIEQLLIDNQPKRPVLWEVGDSTMDPLVIDKLRALPSVSRLYGPPPGDPVGVLYNLRLRWRVLANGPWPGAALRELSHLYSLYGTYVARQGDSDSSFTAASEAFITWPHEAAVINNYALQLQRAGRHEEALFRFKKVIEVRPGYALGWFNLGTAWVNMGNLTEAAYAFGRAQELFTEPTDRTARMAFYMATLHAQNGEYVLAYTLLKAAVPQLPRAMSKKAAQMMLDLDEAMVPR